MKREHAVVVGSSMAGLLAARVLSEHFETVSLIERDSIPDGAEPRKGVPQGSHAHGLLARGQAILEELFPGMSADMVAGGAVEGDIGTLLRFWQFGTWKLLIEMGVRGSFQSRPFLEMHVRRRVMALPNVHFVAGKVTGLLADQRKSRVTGVQLDSGELRATLVVDASGRGSRAPDWLEQLGYPRPEESQVKVRVGYASCYYRRPKDDRTCMIITPEAPRERRLGAMFAIEGDRFIVTLGGWHDDHPPTDPEGWLAFAKTLPVPDLHERLSTGERTSDILVHKLPANLRHHYEKLPRWPEAFVVMGDAVSSFNPVYGQGMTVAGLEALALRDALAANRAADLTGLARKTQKAFAQAIKAPWMLAVGEDLRWPETEGKRGPETNVVNGYIAKVHRLAGTDPEITRAFYRVMHMLAPPTSMFHPRIVLRALTKKPRRLGSPLAAAQAVTAR